MENQLKDMWLPRTIYNIDEKLKLWHDNNLLISQLINVCSINVCSLEEKLWPT